MCFDEDFDTLDLEGWDIAQICTNGHMINACSTRYQKYNQNNCDICGKQSVTQCSYCNADIRGLPRNVSILGGGNGRSEKVPSFCHECGGAYPWTESTLQATRELADTLQGLSDDEKEGLKKSLDDLIAETPRTALAALKWKAGLAKAGQSALDCFREIMSSVMVEAAKRQLFG